VINDAVTRSGIRSAVDCERVAQLARLDNDYIATAPLTQVTEPLQARCDGQVETV